MTSIVARVELNRHRFGGQILLYLGVVAQAFASFGVRVERGEAVDNDGHGQSHENETAQSAHATHDVANRRDWHDVAVAQCGHGHDGPPQTDQYALEFVLFVLK